MKNAGPTQDKSINKKKWGAFKRVIHFKSLCWLNSTNSPESNDTSNQVM